MQRQVFLEWSKSAMQLLILATIESSFDHHLGMCRQAPQQQLPDCQQHYLFRHSAFSRQPLNRGCQLSRQLHSLARGCTASISALFLQSQLRQSPGRQLFLLLPPILSPFLFFFHFEQAVLPFAEIGLLHYFRAKLCAVLTQPAHFAHQIHYCQLVRTQRRHAQQQLPPPLAQPRHFGMHHFARLVSKLPCSQPLILFLHQRRLLTRLSPSQITHPQLL